MYTEIVHTRYRLPPVFEEFEGPRPVSLGIGKAETENAEIIRRRITADTVPKTGFYNLITSDIAVLVRALEDEHIRIWIVGNPCEGIIPLREGA